MTAEIGMQRIGFQDLPLELRRKIYYFTFDEIDSLEIPPRAGLFWVSRLRRYLQPCLKLNHQIREEAIKELQHCAISLVNKLTLDAPEDLLAAIPSTTQLSTVRHLILDKPQDSYIEPAPHSSYSIHDLVSRCPQLEEVTISLRASGFVGENVTELFVNNIFAHRNLFKLHINCNDVITQFKGEPDLRVVKPFEQRFLQEGREKSRPIELDVNLSPYAWNVEESYEASWRREGCVRWVHYEDYFG
jgi:hypothetical protein